MALNYLHPFAVLRKHVHTHTFVGRNDYTGSSPEARASYAPSSWHAVDSAGVDTYAIEVASYDHPMICLSAYTSMSDAAKYEAADVVGIELRGALRCELHATDDRIHGPTSFVRNPAII